MNELPEIPVEIVLSAYKATRLRPLQGDFFVKKNDVSYGCAIGAVMACLGNVGESFAIPSELWTPYTAGFVDGFDGNKNLEIRAPAFNIRYREEWHRGFKDGSATYVAVSRKYGLPPRADDLLEDAPEDVT